MNEHRERRVGEWNCACKSGSLHGASCLRCLRCGTDKPDPVTLGRACYALGVYQRQIHYGKPPAEAMQEALRADSEHQGRR